MERLDVAPVFGDILVLGPSHAFKKQCRSMGMRTGARWAMLRLKTHRCLASCRCDSF